MMKRIKRDKLLARLGGSLVVFPASKRTRWSRWRKVGVYLAPHSWLILVLIFGSAGCLLAVPGFLEDDASMLRLSGFWMGGTPVLALGISIVWCRWAKRQQ